MQGHELLSKGKERLDLLSCKTVQPYVKLLSKVASMKRLHCPATSPLSNLILKVNII